MKNWYLHYKQTSIFLAEENAEKKEGEGLGKLLAYFDDDFIKEADKMRTMKQSKRLNN